MTGTVVVDRWDREDLASVAGLRPYVVARETVAARFDGGGVALDDVFFVLVKAVPEFRGDVPAEERAVRLVVEMVAGLDAVARLRAVTVGDPFAAAMGAVELAPAITETVERLMELPGDGPVEGDGSGLVGQSLGAGAAAASEAAEGASEALHGQEQAGVAWGIEPGSLRHLPVGERLALARTLDSGRVRQITDLFGRLRSASFARPAADDGGWGEVVDLELGGDLARVVPAELLGLVEVGLEDVFLARLANGELAQLETTDVDDTARGGIVLCVDGSDSMHRRVQGYPREMWAQALKLLLIRRCQQQGRALHVIDFGAHREFQHVGFEGPDDFAPAKILATAGAFYGGGTDFETPLREAVRVLETHPGARADVVFVSDGQCQVTERTLAWYRGRTEALGVRTWGVLIAGDGTFSFTDEHWTVRDLTGGTELGELLARVH